MPRELPLPPPIQSLQSRNVYYGYLYVYNNANVEYTLLVVSPASLGTGLTLYVQKNHSIDVSA